jgi:hypothetical protein
MIDELVEPTDPSSRFADVIGLISRHDAKLNAEVARLYHMSITGQVGMWVGMDIGRKPNREGSMRCVV